MESEELKALSFVRRSVLRKNEKIRALTQELAAAKTNIEKLQTFRWKCTDLEEEVRALRDELARFTSSTKQRWPDEPRNASTLEGCVGVESIEDSMQTRHPALVDGDGDLTGSRKRKAARRIKEEAALNGGDDHGGGEIMDRLSAGELTGEVCDGQSYGSQPLFPPTMGEPQDGGTMFDVDGQPLADVDSACPQDVHISDASGTKEKRPPPVQSNLHKAILASIIRIPSIDDPHGFDGLPSSADPSYNSPAIPASGDVSAAQPSPDNASADTRALDNASDILGPNNASTMNRRLHHRRAPAPTAALYVVKGAGQCRACPHCGRVFRKKSHLVDHVRLHTGERPFQCTACDATFVQKTHLKRHYIYKHASAAVDPLC